MNTPLNKPRILPLGVVVMLAGGMWLARYLLPVFLFPSRLWLALVIATAGTLLGLMGAYYFRVHRTTINPFNAPASTSLVTTGVYRFTRNPMYLGFLFYLLGWAAWLGSLPALALAFLLVFYLNRYQIPYEEQALRQLFGHAYVDYCARVRRWL